MNNNIAIALPKNLTKRVRLLQKQLGLKTQGEVILKALSLLEISMGRKIELKDKNKTFEINTFENLKQSIKLDNEKIKQ